MKDIRERLNTLAETLPPESALPEGTRIAAKRRRVASASLTILTVVALIAGGWMAIPALRSDDRRVPPAGTPASQEVTKLEWFGDPVTLGQSEESIWVGSSPRVYQLDDDGTVKGEWRFGNDSLSPNPPPYASIAGVAVASDRLVYVAYTRIGEPEGRDPCGAQPFVPGSATECGRVSLIRSGKAEERATLDEPPTGIVLDDAWAWVSGVTKLYRVNDGDDVLYEPVPLPAGLRAVKLLRDRTHLWLLTEGAESINVLLKLDARTGAEVARTEIPGFVIGVGDRAVWGAGLEREGARTTSTVFRVDAETLRMTGPTNVLTTFLAEGEQPFTPLNPILADAGNVWVGSNDGTVYRIDAQSARVRGSIRTQHGLMSLMRRGEDLWSAHLDARIVRTPARDPVETFAAPEHDPDYRAASPGPGTARATGFTRVDVLGDDRTLVIHFFHGACDHLDHVEITYEATRVVVRPMLADDPRPSGSFCPGLGLIHTTVERLREPLGNRDIVNADA